MTSQCFDKRMEVLPRDLLLRVQDHRLHWQLRRCWDGSAFYRERFESAGLSPDTFGGLTDLSRLPLLTVADLLPLDDAAWRVSPEAWTRMRHEKTGLPTRCLTDGDVTHEQDRVARARWAAGVTRSENYLDEPVGAALMRSGNSRRMGPPPDANTRPIPTHPVTIDGVAVALAYACEQQVGHHIVDDHFLLELIDPGTGRSISDGAQGELIVTDLVREASPLIRFRTGLEAALTEAACACGRTSRRVTLLGQLA